MDIFEVLNEYSNFEECVLIDFWTENLCRDIVLIIDNIWEPFGKMRPDLDNHDIFSFRFATVRKVEIENNFTLGMLAHPDEVNWGWNEFAFVRAEKMDDQIRVEIIWQGGRRITIVADGVVLSRASTDLEPGQYQLAKRSL